MRTTRGRAKVLGSPRSALIALSLLAAAAASGCATCASPPPGLVSWWPGNGSASDAVGQNHGSLEGGVAFVEGKVGQAFRFSSADDIVKIPASPGLNVRDFSIGAWIHPEADDWMLIAEWNSGTDLGPMVWLWPQGTVVTLDVFDTTGAENLVMTPPSTVTLNAWNHVAGTYDSGTGRLVVYVNGSPAAEKSIGAVVPRTGYDFYIGNCRGRNAFAGKIDEVLLFDRALSPEEVRSIFAAGAAGTCGR